MKCSRKLIKGIMFALFASAGWGLFASNSDAEELNVIVPTDRAVYQRGYDNEADVTVKAECDGATKIKARIVDGDNVLCDWTELNSASGNDSEFAGRLNDVKAGGWYQVEVKAYDNSGSEIADGSIEHVGVGEVFITGGQSNSCNFGGEKTQAESDLVSALAPTGAWQHCEDSQPSTSDYSTGNGGGSPWPTLGDELVNYLGVPVGFLTTGRGNTKISDLGGQYYNSLKKAVELIEPYGCRAFLIHQGEADTDKTPMDEYKADYLELIEKVRTDAGYDMNWIIAKVSYAWSNYNNAERIEAITGVQKAICNNYNIFEGPTTDDLRNEYRHTDNLHLSKLGLIEHGKRWAEAIVKSFFTPYSLTADSSVIHGSIIPCGQELYGGQNITLSAVAEDGYYLVPDSYVVNDESGNAVELNNDSFVMRAENMTVSAKFEQLPGYLLDLGAKIKSGSSLDKSIYQQTGFDALNAAIEAAKKIYANPFSTEAEANAAAAAIDTAMGNLVKINAQASPSPAAQQSGTGALASDGSSSQSAVKKGDIINKSGIRYKVTSVQSGKCAVSVSGLVKKKAASAVIPKSIKIYGITYKVTGIDKKAFYGASKLKKIIIKSKTIKSIGSKAFSKVNAKVKITVPSGKYAAYKKMLLKAGVKKASNIIK